MHTLPAQGSRGNWSIPSWSNVAESGLASGCHKHVCSDHSNILLLSNDKILLI